MKRLDNAAQSAPRRSRRLAQALALEEFWRVARLDDARLADAVSGQVTSGGVDAEADALIAERVVANPSVSSRPSDPDAIAWITPGAKATPPAT
ncbi:hypothetical protein AB5I41_17145 [Sphingomonas sp. MMS24-JH45]